MDKVTFRIEGAQELEKLLKELGPRTARKVSLTALRAGARPIIARARQLVPRATGQLAKSITARAGRRAGPTRSLLLIGVRRPRSRIFHLVEFGTAHTAAQPFMRPALDENAGVALDEIGKALGDGIVREALKLSDETGTKRRR